LVEHVLEVETAFTLLVGVDGHELEVHLFRGILSHDNRASIILHGIELAAEDSWEASQDMVSVG
jgi:hypothetical protein